VPFGILFEVLSARSGINERDDVIAESAALAGQSKVIGYEKTGLSEIRYNAGF
jgi:hypothetical protein